MARSWQLMSDYAAESTTYTVPAGGSVDNPYKVPKAGRLVALRLISVGDAATTLTEGIEFKLTNTHWSPNEMDGIVIGGGGLQTAPHLQPPSVDYPVDQPVKEESDIKIEARNVTADTPVGVRVLLMGLFESA